MSRDCSVSARRVYGKVRICRHWGVARSTLYARRAALRAPASTAHRGRPPVIADGDLLVQIRTVLRESEELGWRGEGYRTPTIFVAIDHFVGDIVGFHAARYGTRFEAWEPIHQGLREHFGPLGDGVAEALVVRHDHGAQCMSSHFQRKLRFLGIESSPSFVRAPPGNGAAERFMRSLKEQLLWVRHFHTVEGLRLALLEFKARYNAQWLLQRHDWQTPAAVRAQHSEPLAMAV
ncbi:DDE-type integrase/transposase/recombinase [Thiohalocapsa marina]|uniref:DDE-type integrase/transposase/recombinase n=1 Tax=Thiohalocapsa marina TaxID=424902 RepID=A0A5M8FGW3_9GAMM|nr:integrase core domain-containing protein [Thiohalocapsa marina]KAA6181845.1 DDE-type integrase/transposase/recombinase [Thiohalocapsa marina]